MKHKQTFMVTIDLTSNIHIAFRYQETGSVKPGAIGGTRQKQNNQVDIEKKVEAIKRKNPTICAWQVQEQLVKVVLFNTQHLIWNNNLTFRIQFVIVATFPHEQ